jgi:hypothetical protein
MARPQYLGDGFFVLPVKDKEPYRMWWRFAKAARRPESGLKLHPDYEEWGDFESQEFSVWFDDHWRSLFSVGTGVKELKPGEIVPDAGHRFITILVPLDGYRPEKVGWQLEEIVNQNFVKNDMASKPKATWQITENYHFGMNTALAEAWRYLELYECWLDAKSESVDEEDQFDAAVRKLIEKYAIFHQYLPECYESYVDYLNYKINGGTKDKKDWEHTEVSDNNGFKSFKLTAEDSRRSISRDLTRAKNIAINVANDREFPGYYSETKSVLSKKRSY